MASAVTFIIPGDPVPFARAGSNGAQRFTPRRQRDFMALASLAAHQAMVGRAPFDGPVELCVEAVFTYPKGWSAKRRAATLYKTSRPDLSNIEKLVEDALNEVVFLDDSQVVRRGAGCCKRYGERAETRVTVRSIEPDQDFSSTAAARSGCAGDGEVAAPASPELAFGEQL